jgi:hypothetical protein
MEKIHSVSIYELGMLEICHAKKSTFESLDSLIDHQIKGSTPSSFFTMNLRNKDSSTLKVTSYVETIDPNNIVEVEGSSSDEKNEPIA